jgi:hypothetical protein
VVGYSPTEEKLLGLLPKGGRPISSAELVEGLYQGRLRPFYARNNVVGAMTSLIEKVAINKESFNIQKSKQNGSNLMEYWMTGKP